jgi:DNA-binding transcriptional MocR family regulator
MNTATGASLSLFQLRMQDPGIEPEKLEELAPKERPSLALTIPIRSSRHVNRIK